MPAENVRVIILGQDPYPRKESATGISFHDGMLIDSNHEGRKVSIDNLMILLGLKDINYK